MNLTHSSRLVAGVLFVLVLGAAGTAAAVSVTGDAPEPAQVGEEVSMTATVESPFEGAPGQYTLRGETELRQANWTVEVLNQGRLVERKDDSGPNVTQALDIEDGATTVNVTVTGTVPELAAFNYTDQSVENYTVMALSQEEGDALGVEPWRAHRYTEDSREARLAIENASAAVEAVDGEAGSDQLARAIDAYNAENFDNAVSLAEEAQSQAEEAQGGLPVIPIVVGALVVALIGGGLYYRSQQQTDYKLQ